MIAEALKKMSDEKEKDQTESEIVQTGNANATAPAEDMSGEEVVFELNEPLWAVVTFESCAARNLTYDEAFQKMEEMKRQDISGLCIVTNEAAGRI